MLRLVPMGLSKNRRFFLSLTIVLLIIFSIFVYLELQSFNTKKTQINNANNVAAKEAGLNDYEQLLNNSIRAISLEVKKFGPWVIPKCMICRQKVSGVTEGQVRSLINRISSDLNKTVTELVDGCNDTLWELYVKFLSNSYWLGVKPYLRMTNSYLKGRSVTGSSGSRIIGKDVVVAYKYALSAENNLRLLKYMANSSLKGKMCRVSVSKFSEFVENLYWQLRSQLMEEKNSVLKLLNRSREELYKGKFRTVVSIITMKVSRELEEPNSIFTNTTIFYGNLERDPLSTLDKIVGSYIVLATYLNALENIQVVDSIEKYLSNYVNFKNYLDNITEAITRLYHHYSSNISKELVVHMAGRALLRILIIDEGILSSYMRAADKVNSTALLKIFIDDPNNLLRFIDYYFIGRPLIMLDEILSEV